MLTIYSDSHRLHHGHGELINGELKPCFEMPSRADIVLSQVKKVNLGEVRCPKEYGMAPLLRVHRPDYVEFLQSAWDEWSALGYTHDALPMTWPAHGLRSDIRPVHIEGKLGYYSFDAGVPITSGTWEAVRQSANVALTAAEMLSEGAGSVFALCRPPGHHAGGHYMGGYCFLNNAAIAAQSLLDRGVGRVAILDIDYHHGNGTQSIFYDRADVLFCSLHGDPLHEYPYFLGHADETGSGAGHGFNHNYPLPHGTGWDGYSAALEDACNKIRAFAPDALVISLGVDTFKDDPISKFKLESDDYRKIGQFISGIDVPTLFVMEGGYAVDEIGLNAVNVLQGFEESIK